MRTFFIQGLMFLCVILFSPNGMAVDVTAATPIALAEQVAWCATDAKLDIAAVTTGACVFKQGTVADMAHGFSEQAFWLRLTLENPAAIQTEHWLRIGHSRLQQVSLFEPAASGKWHRTNTGLLTPAALRPLVSTYPVFPLTLTAHETRTIYVRVESESFIDITPTLWTPNAYTATHHRQDIFLVLTMGGLLMTAVLSVLLFFRQRERAYLFFAGILLFGTLYAASYTGLLPTYLWPASLPYDIRLQGVMGFSSLSFVFFVRSFVGEIRRYPRYYQVLYLSTLLMVSTFLWGALVSYRAAALLGSLAYAIVTFSGIALFARSWRDGSRSAGYVLLSYSALIFLSLYRIIVEQSAGDYTNSQLFTTLASMLLTPTVLFGIAIHSEELHSALLQSRTISHARMKFLAQMSHEFRTPLNTVLGYAELLLRGSARVSLPEGIAAIKTSSRHLLGMIDDILDQVRGESGQLTLRTAPVAWGSFMQSLEQTAAMMMKNHGNQFQLQLIGEMPAVVLIDELHLHGVLSNLLSNANRYTQNGNITLSCAGEAVNNEHCRFTLTVSDTGQGIATNEQASIFEPFVRGTAGKCSGIDGIGMGLVIAQQWVKLMGGEIQVNSKLGQGSSFYFSIECALAEVETPVVTVPERAVVLGKHTILVVEDDENSRQLLSMLLADYGFEVLTAKSGNDARQFLPNLLPSPVYGRGGGGEGEGIDLVITDQFMPDGDGWSVLQDWAARPVMLLSAAAPDRPSNLPDNLDFASVHLKPFDANAILNAISTILSLEWATTADAPAENIPPPPMALLEPLKIMIEQGAVTDIAEWLADFDAKYPQHHPYTAQIISANLTLDFKELRRLTAEIP